MLCRKLYWFAVIIAAVIFIGCSSENTHLQKGDKILTIDLAGKWGLKVDPEGIGEKEKWFTAHGFKDKINLPGSLTGAGLGDEVTAQTQWTLSMWNKNWQEEEKYKKHLQGNDIKVPFCLQPVKHYIGKAWYSRAFTIPAELQGKHMSLLLERCHWEATVWIDGKRIGTENSLCTPNRFQIGSLSTGTHRITMCIDNTVKINVGERRQTRST